MTSAPRPDLPAADPSSSRGDGAPAPWRHHPARWITLGVLTALVVGVGVSEWLGWPYLAGPVQRVLSERLDRNVNLRAFEAGQRAALRIHLLGGLRIHADAIQVGGPAWRPNVPTLNAQDVTLAMRYRDLWALRQGEGLQVKALKATRLDVVLERLPDGRASWQFGTGSAGEPPARRPGVSFDELEVTRGIVVVHDAPTSLDAEVVFALRDRRLSPESVNGNASAPGPAGEPARPGSPVPLGLQAQARGQYRDARLTATLQSDSPLPWISGSTDIPPVAVRLDARAGATQLAFDGSVRDLVGMGGLRGRYTVSGPSLAAVGEPLGVVLPTTPAFHVDGDLSREGPRWVTQVRRATIGRSELRGEFAFTPGVPASRHSPGAARLPLLTGRLAGPALWLADLGPAVGADGAQGRSDAPAPPAGRAGRPDGGKVLPDRRFDLPSLSAMNADVQVDLTSLHLGSAFAETVAPLRGRLRLHDGVLSLNDLDARTADGRIAGDLTLDGRRRDTALWDARLRWSGVRLEQWIKQTRGGNAPPYASGQLGGRLALQGRGRSTAEILGSARGEAQVLWTQGAVSHLAVEAMGIDVAQALGMLVKGDDALPVLCGAGDLAIVDGRVSPKVMLIDTRDSTVWIEGNVSLASEALDLRLRASPKDFSPLALRTPIELHGTLGAPQVALEKAPLARRLVPAALLALVNPLAAVLPLIDTGDKQEAQRAVAGCQAVLDRSQRAAQVGAPAPRSGS